MACSSSNSPSACPPPDAASLNSKFSCPGVSVECGKGGLPKVRLYVNGSSAEVYLHGACITSWKPACAATDLLFVRPDNDFSGHPKPISGGIPHCFPQFGPGKIQQHGFARNLSWEICSTRAECGSAHVVLSLKPNTYTKCMWDYTFLLTYKVILWPTKPNTIITLQNTDSRPFEFTTALHSYFRAVISGVQVRGLKGCKFLTKDKVPAKGCEQRDTIVFTKFCDCLYFCAPNELQLDNGLGSTIGVHNHGWPDAVLWSPIDQIGSWKDFVCVENALNPVQLCPCGTWSAEQILCMTEYPFQHIPSLRTDEKPMKDMKCLGQC